MFRNYFKTAWRNLWKHRLFSFINISGLAIGLCSCMLIIMYVRDELSFDIFHKNGNRLYRITQTISDPSGKHDPRQSGNTSMIAGEVIKTEVPEVKDIVR